MPHKILTDFKRFEHILKDENDYEISLIKFGLPAPQISENDQFNYVLTG